MDEFNGAVLVAEGGSVIYSKGFGYADFENKIPNTPQTKFRLASITKQFTAALIMQLVEKGKIQLDGRLSGYLPYYRKDIGDKITIHQILSHTSGLANYTDKRELNEAGGKVEPKDFIIKYCSDNLISEPGTSWAYSNTGYFILGAVIEEITGKTYEQNLQENILTPLEMTNTGMEQTGRAYDNMAKGYINAFGEYIPAKPAEMSIPFSAGAMYSTLEDMYKWDRALYTEKILTKASLEKMFTPVMNDYGYGWRIGDQPIGDKETRIAMHTGGIQGFNSMEIRFINDDKYIMVLCNFENANPNPMNMGIMHILYGLEAPKPKKSIASEIAKLLKNKGIEQTVAEFNTMKNNPGEYRKSEREINQLGYILLQDGKIKESIEVFKMNVELYPESANVYDSLGEAYAESGEKEKAIQSYKKSIELNPGNAHGKEMLEKLEGK
jgi:CubicO group peptidase (beta-lactamase class C family)